MQTKVKYGEVVKKVIENYDYLEKMNNQLYSLYNDEITLLYNEYNNLLSKL